MYKKTVWQDHVVEKPDTYREVQNADGTVTHTPAEGEIIQQGTPMSATNYNNMEDGIFENNIGISMLLQEVLQHKRNLLDLEGEKGQKVLTNSKQYPFNDATQTVSLTKSRDTLNYRVDTEIINSNGTEGNVEVYDKQLNGFKLRFTGSAATATIKYIVQGGMYQ